MLNITLNDLWPDLKAQINKILPAVMDKDAILYDKLNTLVSKYETKYNGEEIIASVAIVNSIYDVISGRGYMDNIRASETLQKDLMKFTSDLDMFRTIMNNEYDNLLFKRHTDQFKDDVYTPGTELGSEQLKRNADIYNKEDDKVLREALAKDKEKRKEEIKKIFANDKQKEEEATNKTSANDKQKEEEKVNKTSKKTVKEK